VTSRHCRSYDTYSPRLQCNSRVTRLPLEPKSSFHPILRLLLLAIRRKTLTSPSFFILVSSATCNPRLPITGCLLAFAVVEFDLGRFQGGNRERTRPRPDLSLSLLFFSPCPSRSLAPAGDAPSLRSRRRFLGLGNGVSAPSHTHTPPVPLALSSPGRPIAIIQSSSRDTNRTRWPPFPPPCSLSRAHKQHGLIAINTTQLSPLKREQSENPLRHPSDRPSFRHPPPQSAPSLPSPRLPFLSYIAIPTRNPSIVVILFSLLL
jgi:hypothetical protein